MKHARTDRRRANHLSRLVFASGVILLVPGMGLTLRAHPLAEGIAVVSTEPLSLSAVPTAADEPKADGPKSQAVLDKLKEKLDFDFREGTPLWDVVNYMSVASSGPDGKGFDFDFDEASKKAGKGRHTPIPIALNGKNMSIKTGLQKVLKPMGLTYSVKEGVLMIKVKPEKTQK